MLQMAKNQNMFSYNVIYINVLDNLMIELAFVVKKLHSIKFFTIPARKPY